MEFEKIKEMILRANPSVAANLLARLEQMQLSENLKFPIDDLISLARQKTIEHDLEAGRIPSPSRMFFTPFESLFEDIKDGEMQLPGSFDRSALRKIWEVISQKIAKEYFDNLVPKLKAALIINDMRTAKHLAKKLREIAFGEICETENKRILHVLDNSISEESAIRFVNLLAVEHEARIRDISLEVDVGEINDAEIREYVNLLTILDERDLFLAADFMLCLMGNTQKPWQVLRIIKSAVLGINDRKLAATAYSVVGDRLLAMMRRRADAFSRLRKSNKISGIALAEEIENYNQISMGIERSNILVDGGPWMIRLKENRSKAAQMFNEFCERAESAISNALPLDRGRIKGVGAFDIPRCQSDLNMEKVELAMELGIFIRQTRLFAPNAGFGAARESTHKVMLRHCDNLKSGMIAIMGHEDRGKYFDKWADVAIEIIAIVEDEAAAKSLERKIAA